MSVSPDKIRVILIDDHETIHLEIGALLSTLDDIELLAEGYTGEDAVRLARQYQPDVVLMDVAMPTMNGIEATKAITALYPRIKILTLSGMDDVKTVRQMIAAGAVGYVLKEARPEELAVTIRDVHGGKAVFSSELVDALLKPNPAVAQSIQDYGLTRREVEILRCLAESMTNAEIAEALTISQATVKFHISNILRKLNVNTRSGAVVLAARQGIVS